MAGTDSWFHDPASRVSAHYGISKAGEIHQYVHEADTAYHAGIVDNPTWPLLIPSENPMLMNPNHYTFGLEHEGHVTDGPWPEAQLQASAALIADICRRHGIPIDDVHVIGHHAIRAMKPCPGPGCDLAGLIARALLISSGDLTT